MEEALLTRFLESKILFLLTTDFERNLKKEIWLCHKHMKLSLSEIYSMTVADRRTFIAIHNKETEKEKEKFENRFKRRK